MIKTVFITCNNIYVPKAIVALQQFCSYNIDFKKVIIGSLFNDEMHKLCKEYDIELFSIDLSNDFIDLNKRPYGKQYPIECFYHFYAYKILDNSHYIIKIEPDIYTNKKIDIDLNSIPYIAGSYTKGNFINNFMCIMNDYNKINKIYKNLNTGQHRICGGVNIYNVKGLKSIDFYKKIVEYYNTSISINAPRCGDDSLMVMYQMINPSHIILLNPEFHVIFYEKIVKEYQEITFFHFGGKTEKYWKINNEIKLHQLIHYFYDNMIEYIYNNFTINFIKKYLPEIYIDISNIKIPFYYYNSEDNFGDLITPYFLKKFCKKEDFFFDFTNNNPKIISCGSIMRLCHKKTIVYGSGIRDIDQDIKEGIIKIVRGPLTRNRLQKIGCYCPPIYGDPGLLLPLYYNPKIEKKYKIGIIPHHIHYEIIKKMYSTSNDIKIINLINKNIESVINDILSCTKTISSSLHGLIISDAYNIPNKWVKFDNKITGDDTKFYDYFESVKRLDIEYINCMEYKYIPEEIYDLINEVKIIFDVNYLKQKMFFDENGLKNYTKYLYKKHIDNNK
jgi:pyruvyltransferase